MPPVNDRLLRALAKEPVDPNPGVVHAPGRALPPGVPAVRERAGSFLALCSTPELACEVTLQPLRRFALDAAILFSDILTIPWAMGAGARIRRGRRSPVPQAGAHGGRHRPLGSPDPEDDLGFVMDAVRAVRHELDGRVPLIGFAGSPWTLATYMIEGRGSRDFARAKTMLIEHPRELHRLLALLAAATTGYLAAQVRAGAQALMIFDTWGGILTTPAYHEFSLEYMRRIVERLPPRARIPGRPGGAVHQGRRGVDRVDGAKRLRRGRARLDGGSRGRARAGGSAGRVFRETWTRRRCSHRRPGSAARWAASSPNTVRAPGMSSTSGTGSRRTSIRSTSAPVSTPCTHSVPSTTAHPDPRRGRPRPRRGRFGLQAPPHPRTRLERRRARAQSRIPPRARTRRRGRSRPRRGRFRAPGTTSSSGTS